MSRDLYQKLLTSYDLTAVHGVHLIGRRFFKGLGYRWEVRNSGDMKIGYWKKSLRKRNPKSHYPKRFVIIPGFGDTPLSWYSVTLLLYPFLKKNYDEILLFDFPAFGGFLSREKAFPSIDFMMGMLNDTLDSLKPHTILGHSLGGWLTAHYAASCGSGVRPTSNKLNYAGPQSILLVNPAGIFHNEENRKNWDRVFQSARQGGFNDLRPHLFAKEPSWFRYLVRHYEKFFLREDIHQFMDSFREEHAADRVAKQIRAKVWLIWGEKDTLTPFASATHWLLKLKNDLQYPANAVMLRGVGHSPQLESPAITAAVIAQIILGRKPHSLGNRWWKIVDYPNLKLLSWPA